MRPPRFTLRYYVLDADNRVVAANLIERAQWFEAIGNRVVGYTQITSECQVSTVFLGLDHRFGGDGPPLVFETMIFGGPLQGSVWRYSSYDDADAGHKAAVRRARAAHQKRQHLREDTE